MTASRSGFGMPFLFVLPSRASENIVSISCSNWRAGRISQRKRAAVSPEFQNLCAVPGSTTSFWPPFATTFLRPTLKVTSPSSTSKVSVWYGCRWAAATEPFGSTITSTTTYSPLVSAAALTKRISSPVAGFCRTSPVRITLGLLGLGIAFRSYRVSSGTVLQSSAAATIRRPPSARTGPASRGRRRGAGVVLQKDAG